LGGLQLRVPVGVGARSQKKKALDGTRSQQSTRVGRRRDLGAQTRSTTSTAKSAQGFHPACVDGAEARLVPLAHLVDHGFLCVNPYHSGYAMKCVFSALSVAGFAAQKMARRLHGGPRQHAQGTNNKDKHAESQWTGTTSGHNGTKMSGDSRRTHPAKRFKTCAQSHHKRL
jgi:hypothetical protein